MQDCWGIFEERSHRRILASYETIIACRLPSRDPGSWGLLCGHPLSASSRVGCCFVQQMAKKRLKIILYEVQCKGSFRVGLRAITTRVKFLCFLGRGLSDSHSKFVNPQPPVVFLFVPISERCATVLGAFGSTICKTQPIGSIVITALPVHTQRREVSGFGISRDKQHCLRA